MNQGRWMSDEQADEAEEASNGRGETGFTGGQRATATPNDLGRRPTSNVQRPTADGDGRRPTANTHGAESPIGERLSSIPGQKQAIAIAMAIGIGIV